MSETRRFDPIDEAGRQWRRHWGSSHVAEMMAVTSIMRVQQILLARLDETLDQFGLTFARYEALMLQPSIIALPPAREASPQVGDPR